MMAKPRGTDGSLLSSLPWTLFALAFAMAPHVVFLPVWVTAAFVVCAAWRFVIEKRRRPLPSTWFRAFLALLCFLGVLATYSTISGVGPGSALLAVMAALKLLETRKRRDQFVLLFIAIFLVMSSLLREQYLWSLPYLLLGVFLIMAAWLRVSAVATEPVRRSFATGGRLIMYAVPLAVAMWIFFPRIATPFWAVPMDTGTATSGLSDKMSPGDISSLSLSDAVAFRVTFPGVVPEPRDRYWRGLVLTRFNGRTWTSNDPFEGPRVHEQVTGSGETIAYQITMEPTRQPWVFALDMPWSWNLPRTFMGPQQQLARARPIDQRIAYEAESYLDYRTESDAMANVGAYTVHPVTITGSGMAERRQAAWATRSLFDVLGVSASIGRIFSEDEDTPGGANVVILSHAYWQSHYGGEPGVVGTQTTTSQLMLQYCSSLLHVIGTMDVCTMSIASTSATTEKSANTRRNSVPSCKDFNTTGTIWPNKENAPT